MITLKTAINVHEILQSFYRINKTTEVKFLYFSIRSVWWTHDIMDIREPSKAFWEAVERRAGKQWANDLKSNPNAIPACDPYGYPVHQFPKSEEGVTGIANFLNEKRICASPFMGRNPMKVLLASHAKNITKIVPPNHANDVIWFDGRPHNPQITLNSCKKFVELCESQVLMKGIELMREGK